MVTISWFYDTKIPHQGVYPFNESTKPEDKSNNRCCVTSPLKMKHQWKIWYLMSLIDLPIDTTTQPVASIVQRHTYLFLLYEDIDSNYIIHAVPRCYRLLKYGLGCNNEISHNFIVFQVVWSNKNKWLNNDNNLHFVTRQASQTNQEVFCPQVAQKCAKFYSTVGWLTNQVVRFYSLPTSTFCKVWKHQFVVY